MGHQGTNHSGHEYVCGSCQKRCAQFVPDNRTAVPVCPECWAKLNVVQRLMVLAAMKQAGEISDLVNVITAAVRSNDLVTGAGRSRKNEGN